MTPRIATMKTVTDFELTRALADGLEAMNLDQAIDPAPMNRTDAEALRMFRTLRSRDAEALIGVIEQMPADTQGATLEAMRAAVAALPTIH